MGVYVDGRQSSLNPKFKETEGAYARAIKMIEEIKDEEQLRILANLTLVKLYQKAGNMELALERYNTFFKRNAEAGGNTTHYTLTNLKDEIDKM